MNKMTKFLDLNTERSSKFTDDFDRGLSLVHRMAPIAHNTNEMKPRTRRAQRYPKVWKHEVAIFVNAIGGSPIPDKAIPTAKARRFENHVML